MHTISLLVGYCILFIVDIGSFRLSLPFVRSFFCSFGTVCHFVLVSFVLVSGAT